MARAPAEGQHGAGLARLALLAGAARRAGAWNQRSRRATPRQVPEPSAHALDFQGGAEFPPP